MPRHSSSAASTAATSAEDELTLSLPSLAFVAILTIFAIRWFWTSTSSSSRSTGPSGRSSRVNPEHIEQISQMFPQLSRRDIMWDLRRNGGSVTATTERILQGRGLERPPPSFQPEIPPPSSTPYTASTPSAPAPKNPDLITRYNLQSRIDEEKASTDTNKSGGWSTNKSERALNLQRRRDEMILAARRKMMAKEKTTVEPST